MRRGLLLAFLSLLAVGAATAQEPTVGAAVNEASGEPLLSPGVLAAIFGQNLTEGCMDSAPAGRAVAHDALQHAGAGQR